MSLSSAERKELRLRAMHYLVGLGYTAEGSAGIVGNLMAESGMQADISQIGGGGGYGLAQWTWPPRKRALKVFAEDKGKQVSDFELQLEFLAQELAGSEFKALDRVLRTTTSAKAAANLFCMVFERPGIPHLDKRIGYAEHALAEYRESA